MMTTRAACHPPQIVSARSCRRAHVAFVSQKTELTKTTISVESCASGSCPKLLTRRSPKTGSMSAAHALGTSHLLFCPVAGSTAGGSTASQAPRSASQGLTWGWRCRWRDHDDSHLEGLRAARPIHPILSVCRGRNADSLSDAGQVAENMRGQRPFGTPGPQLKCRRLKRQSRTENQRSHDVHAEQTLHVHVGARERPLPGPSFSGNTSGTLKGQRSLEREQRGDAPAGNRIASLGVTIQEAGRHSGGWL